MESNDVLGGQMSYSLNNMCAFQESKGPKATISVKDLNATFQPEKIGHAHGLQITYSVDDHTRNLFVYHKNGQVNLFIPDLFPRIVQQ